MKMYRYYGGMPLQEVAVLIIILCSCLPHFVVALPSGAASCNVGSAAVGGIHLSSTDLTTGPASGDSGYKLTIDEQVLAPDTAFNISLDTSSGAQTQTQTHKLLLEATVPTSNFKGYSVILDLDAEADTDIAADLLVLDDTTQKDNPLCTGNAVGITHVNNLEKSKVELTLEISFDGTLLTNRNVPFPLDITIVVQNSNGISEYYYSQYLLNIVDETPEAPTPATPWDLIANTPELVVFAENIATVPPAMALLESRNNTLTVFGPIDSAFDNIEDERLLRILTDPEFDMHLEDLMLYQIHKAQAFSENALIAKATAQEQLVMANEQAMPLFLGTTTSSGGFVELNGQGSTAALISQADLMSAKSVIHTIDKLLLPPSATLDIFAACADAYPEKYSTLVQLMVVAGWNAPPQGPGPLTLFAPTNDAFAKMDPVELAYLMSNTDLLTDVLTYHVTGGVLTSSDLQSTTTQQLTMLNDKQITLQVSSSSSGGTTGTITSTSGNVAAFTSFDLLVNNGVIHSISEVLIPEAIIVPTTPAPSTQPSADLSTGKPSSIPSVAPSVSVAPTITGPTTLSPTTRPTNIPSSMITLAPTMSPSGATMLPSNVSSAPSTNAPSKVPTSDPTTMAPSRATLIPSNTPSKVPTSGPTSMNTTAPSLFLDPSAVPTAAPTSLPNTTAPSTSQPTVRPTNASTPEPSSEPSSEPSQSPTSPSTAVVVNTTFVLFNTDGIMAQDLSLVQYAGPLNRSFEIFVKSVVEDVQQAQTNQRLLRHSERNRERYLAATLQPNSIELYDSTDVPCPTTTSDGSSIPDNANCQNVFGRYFLSVVGDDPELVQVEYTSATNKALEEGKLQATLQLVDPNSPFTVAGPPGQTDDDSKESDAGMATWLILVITLCCACGLGVIAFALYYFVLEQKEPMDEEDKGAMESQLMASEVEPPPPDAFSTIIEPVEDEVWSDEDEEEDRDEETQQLFSDQETTVIVEEDEVDNFKDEGGSINDSSEEQEEILLLENGPDNSPVKQGSQDDGFALESVEEGSLEELENVEEDSFDENARAEDPPEFISAEDAPGLRQSDMDGNPDLGGSEAENEAKSDAENITTEYNDENTDPHLFAESGELVDEGDGNSTLGDESWRVPDISIQDAQDVEDFLRKSSKRGG